MIASLNYSSKRLMLDEPSASSESETLAVSYEMILTILINDKITVIDIKQIGRRIRNQYQKNLHKFSDILE